MGLCLSSGVAAAMAEAGMAASTAMVLLPTGELREYPRPATAARVLEDVAAAEGEEEDVGRRFFLCDADKMGFEGPVAAVAAAAELRPGQIYFVLPGEVRRRGMRREEVAALAVKASAALAAASSSSTTSGCGGGRRRRGSVAPLVFAPPEEEYEYDASDYCKSNASAAAAAAGKRRPVAARRGGGKGRQFATDLTAIPELDMITE
ncbi:uncharacterized protein [Oryza sativa Japonica Group]|uniref:Os07g0123100 protein n=5 Tax=Oryza TaxID=4527 RepID=Q6Z4S0_ORYSJ|nr:uncharacterized protein LOC9271184 [Oryza sativa Japonica Group]KAB8104178.1 hypothetical protein EE612_036882 [Oryza sativa]BAC83793.1 hypothetical protein [Oryza sativa Japonica Group]BAS99872.1 Os07g0123100 [Oryza sativa Japonica Group]